MVPERSPQGALDFPQPRDRRFERQSGAGGPILRKVFPQAQAEAFARERAALAALQGPGVPELLAGGPQEDGSLALEIRDLGGEDLRRRVARLGPLPLGEVLDLGERSARLLARVHAADWVHGDLKPGNFVLSQDGLHLVDWEEARPLDAPAAAGRSFSGGTHGYAPPEAYLGEAPAKSFDLYGLGAVLHFLLTGFPPEDAAGGRPDLRLLHRLRPALPAALELLVEALLQPDPALRPPAQVVAEELSAVPRPDARFEAFAAAVLGAPVPDGEPPPELAPVLARLETRRARLVRLLQAQPPTPEDLSPIERVEGAWRFLRRGRICLAWMPCLPALRKRMARGAPKLHELLAGLPDSVKALRARMELAEARRLAHLGLNLCRLLAGIPLADVELPALIESCGHALQSALRRLEREEGRLRAFTSAIEEAEAALDLERARKKLDALQAGFSGANRVAARLRDRLHRLAWLLDRLLLGRRALDEAEALLGGGGTAALRAFLERAARARGRPDKPGHHSLNQFARVLKEIAADHPRLVLQEAVHEVDALRRRLTSRAAELLDRMGARLEADPVPLRLLLRDLAEVDRIVLLDGFADGPEASRVALLDRLEALRLKIEELAERGRLLAKGARDQIEQGRLTTALYDLERALQAGLAAAPDDGGGLHAEVERVRRLKEELHRAHRRDFELADLQARLLEEDRPLEHLLRVFEQREEVLQFLVERGGPEDKERAQRELYGLRLARIRARAGAAERAIEESDDPEEKRRLAAEILELLADPDGDAAALGPRAKRIAGLSRRFEEHYVRAGREIEERRAAARRRRLRRNFALAGGGLAALLAAAIFLPGMLHSSRAAVAAPPAAYGTLAQARSPGDVARVASDKALPMEVRDALDALVLLWRRGKARARPDFARLRSRIAGWPAHLRPYAEPLLALLDRLLAD